MLQVPDLETLVKTLKEEVKKERKEKEEVIAAKDRLKQEKDTVRDDSVVHKPKCVIIICVWWVSNSNNDELRIDIVL